MRWILKMAWRDSRASRRRLALYSASIVLGIAALVAIVSFGYNLKRALAEQSLTLLGADLVVSSHQPFNANTNALLDRLGGRHTDEIDFSSMLLFPRTGRTRLVSVRAVEPEYPYYGRIETDPASAADVFRSRREVLVEENLLLQFGARVGDAVKLGNETFTIAGALKKVPGESPAFSLVASRVYLARKYLAATGLLKFGSRVTYRRYFAFPHGTNVDSMIKPYRERLREAGVHVQTVAGREASLGRAYDNFDRFLMLSGFVALLLGCIGVASGIHAHVHEKVVSVAVLRCLGASNRQVFCIYLVQAMVLGLAGSSLGVLLGAGLQFLIPRFLGSILPVAVPTGLDLWAALEGLGVGLGMTVLFALLPLIGLRRISPLVAIRSTVTERQSIWRDHWYWFVWSLLAAGVVTFAIVETRDWKLGMGFAGGVCAVFAGLAGLGRFLMGVAKRTRLANASYLWRQGIANLFRPNNRTVLLILALGMGTFLVMSLQLSQEMLLRGIARSQAGNRSNLIMFDIQPDQRHGVEAILKKAGVPLMHEAPIVTMRLASIKGETVEALRRKHRHRHGNWALTREYRSTYRSTLEDTERIKAGQWIGQAPGDGRPVPVSVAEGIADDLDLTVGDRLTFNVQGLPVECRVASIRQVDWQRIQPNFFVVFPNGVLEDAPQTFVMAGRAATPEESARVQRQLVERYPNVSAIDLSLILKTVNGILNKMRFVFQFMALFTVLTGLLVLSAAILTGRHQRLRESVLLRTLGAVRSQVMTIQFIEYAVLGTLAALSGCVLAWFASWALGRWVFDLRVLPAIAPLVWAWGGVTLVTLLAGWLSGIRIHRQPPLAVLRAEG